MLLVAWAADINAAILKTQTPLHWAFLYGDLESFNALLMAGPNVVATSIRGNTISLLPYFILLPFVFLMFVEALHCSAKRFDYVDTITGMINGLLPAWANRGAINASEWVILKQYPSLGKYLIKNYAYHFWIWVLFHYFADITNGCKQYWCQKSSANFLATCVVAATNHLD